MPRPATKTATPSPVPTPVLLAPIDLAERGRVRIVRDDHDLAFDAVRARDPADFDASCYSRISTSVRLRERGATA